MAGDIGMIKGSEVRKADHEIEPILLDRFSPRERIGRNLRFIRGIRVTCRAVASREGGSAVQQFFKFL
jgi:hypothetical protein